MKIEQPPMYPPPGRIVMDDKGDPSENRKELDACIQQAMRTGPTTVYIPAGVVVGPPSGATDNSPDPPPDRIVPPK